MKHSRSDYDVIQDLTVAYQLAALFLYGDRRINRQAVARQLASEILGLETKVRHNDEPFFSGNSPSKLVPWNEPVFLLRAEDSLSDRVLKYWIEEAIKEGVNPDLIKLIQKHAEMMREWPEKRLPEIPQEVLDAVRTLK